MRGRLRAGSVVAATGLAVLGCGSGSGSGAIGQAADKASASRVIEVRQLQELKFEPASVAVRAGETVTFRITNAGTQVHEFFIGDQKAHDEHDDSMGAMGSEPMKMKAEPNAVTVDPGASAELTWAFPKKGNVQFACHEPGHYDDGMKGTVKVS